MEEETKNKPDGEEKKNRLREFWQDTKKRFSLNEGSAPQEEVIAGITEGIYFRGANMWILMFATMVASLGLNVDSTAVIIGAMLISPLMGPIIGFGLAMGINDFALMKKSLKNFGFMVGTAIVTATLFFIVSPISGSQSELLARTQPTIYDVMIAFFGGAAGVVAYTRKDRTFTVISGVAIATALMPPLCTAGFGIATGQWKFFAGALYLFVINAIFIALATYAIIRVLQYRKKTFVEPKTERRVQRIMWSIIIITILPSIYIAFRLIDKSVFERNADRFVAAEFQFDDTQVLEKTTEYVLHDFQKHGTVTLVLYGEPLSQDAIENIRRKMPTYDLADTDLIIKQANGMSHMDFTPLQQGYAQVLDEKNRQLDELRRQAGRTSRTDSILLRETVVELGAIMPGVERIWISKEPVSMADGTVADSILVCIIKSAGKIAAEDMERMKRWLQVKSKTDNVRIYVE